MQLRAYIRKDNDNEGTISKTGMRGVSTVAATIVRSEEVSLLTEEMLANKKSVDSQQKSGEIMDSNIPIDKIKCRQ